MENRKDLVIFCMTVDEGIKLELLPKIREAIANEEDEDTQIKIIGKFVDRVMKAGRKAALDVYKSNCFQPRKVIKYEINNSVVSDIHDI